MPNFSNSFCPSENHNLVLIWYVFGYHSRLNSKPNGSKMSIGFIKKTILYGLSSLLALITDVGCMTLLVEFFQVQYLTASAIGFSLGCVVNYVVSKLYVFEDLSGNSPTVTISLFVLVGLVGLLLNQLIMWVAVEYFAAHYLLAKGFSTALVFWFNFLFRGYFVFKDPDLCKIQHQK